jgi:hypothetical protein
VRFEQGEDEDVTAALAPAPDDLIALEQAVQATLRGSGTAGLDVLGYGEISCVVSWRGFACKRLPLFGERARAESYRACFDRYLGLLRARGIATVDSSLVLVDSAAGACVAYCAQPVIAPALLLPAVLGRASPGESDAIFERILDHIESCLDGRTGLDAQVSNWATDEDGRLRYLDVTTPLFRDDGGREALDTDVFIAGLPRLVRGLVRRFLLGSILGTYYERRLTVLDVLGNLYNERLERLIPSWRERANRRLDQPLDEREVRRYHRADALTWALVHKLVSFERFWTRTVRRRVYPMLLPDRRARR